MQAGQAKGRERDLLDRLLVAHREESSGVLGYEIGDRSRQLLLERGELYVAADSVLAGSVREVAASTDPQHWEPLLRKIHEGYLAGAARGIELRKSAGLPEGALGPLPTEALLRRGYAELAELVPVPETDLIGESRDLGGERAPLCWSPEENWIFERLRRPMRLEALQRECPFPVERLNAALAGLVSVGRVHAPGRPPLAPSDSGLLRLVELLNARIGASLKERPLGLLDDALQRRLAALLAGAEQMNHYEFLKIDPDADEGAIQAAFEEVARQVHPIHSTRPALNISSAEFARLFERAVAALRTLGDPALRAAYDVTHEIQRHAHEQTSTSRRRELAELARREFDRARFEELNGDLHSALVLYERVVELDPRAEYQLTLARLLAKNPAWSTRAIEMCKRAIELDPEGSEARFLAGELYERLGQFERAAAQFQAAAGGRTPHPGAQAALQRMHAKGVGRDSGAGSSALSRLFRRD